MRRGRFAVVSGLFLCASVRAARAEDASGPAEEVEHEVEALSALTLEELLDLEVVTSAKKPLTLFESPANVEVITAADLRNRGYLSLAEVLQSFAGTFVLDDQAVPDVAVRGVSAGIQGQASLLKVMIDGVPTHFSPETSHFIGAEQVPLAIVERIEFIRGPASALYGANAFVGVVNIITREPSEGLTGGVQARGHSHNGAHFGAGGTVHLQVRTGNFSGSLAVAADRYDASGLEVSATYPNQSTGIGAVSEGDLRSPKSAHLKLGYHSETAGLFTLRSSLQHLSTHTEFAYWNLASHRDRLSVLNGHCVLGWDNQSPDLPISLYGGLRFGQVLPDERLDSGSADSDFRRDLQTREGILGGEITFRFSPEYEARAGFDLSIDRQTRSKNLEILRQDRGAARAGEDVSTAPRVFDTYRNVGAYGQFLARPVSWMNGIAGVRYDHNSSYGASVSVRGGLVWLPARPFALKALFGQSFKAPSPTQLTARPASPSLLLDGAPDLEPQRASTGELAASWVPVSWLTGTINGYFMQTEDLIQYDYIGYQYRGRNNGRLVSKGLEATVRFITTHVDGFVAFSASDAQQANRIDLELGLPSQRVRGVPRLVGSLGVLGRFPGVALVAYAELRVADERLATSANAGYAGGAPYALDLFAVLDASLRYDAAELGVPLAATFRAKNVLDARYATPGFAGYDIPNQGRSLHLLVDWAF